MDTIVHVASAIAYVVGAIAHAADTIAHAVGAIAHVTKSMICYTLYVQMECIIKQVNETEVSRCLKFGEILTNFYN